MQRVRAVVLFIFVIVPGIVNAEPSSDARAEGVEHEHYRFSVHAGAGVTTRGGDVQAVSIGYSPTTQLTFLVNGERIHLPTRRQDFGRGFSAERGGTLQFVSGELRFTVLPGRRASPYVLGGVGFGRSRPNVNATFPDPVRNTVGMVFGGAGASLPVGSRFTVFADVRFALAAERDTVMLLVPLRGGLTWHF